MVFSSFGIMIHPLPLNEPFCYESTAFKRPIRVLEGVPVPPANGIFNVIAKLMFSWLFYVRLVIVLVLFSFPVLLLLVL